MNRVIRLFSIGILSVFLFGIASTQDVSACTSIERSLTEIIQNREIIVRGEFVDIDESNQNAILHVKEYMKGTGGEYILLSFYDPVMMIRSIHRDVEGCYYGVGSLPFTQEIIAFLTPKANGSYSGGYFPQDMRREFWIEGDDSRELSYEEFARVTQDIIGEPSAPPQPDIPYPMLAPLLITSENGQRYLFPVNFQEPILLTDEEFGGLYQFKPACWANNCRAWSPNGLYNAIIDENGIITINPESYQYQHTFERPANAILFSPSNDGMAVFTNTGIGVLIEIYTFEVFYSFSDYNNVESRYISADTINPNMALWSPNGRILAISDRQNIYLWDAFTAWSHPQVLAVTDMPLYQFSPLGNYLSIGTDENGFSIDLINQQILPLGAISPNEQYIATYGDNSITKPLSPFRRYADDIIGGISSDYRDYSVIEVQWLSNTHYIVHLCHNEDISNCIVIPFYYGNGYFSTRGSFLWQDISDIAVHPQHKILGMVTYPHTIILNSMEYDLSPYLDSPIASIEWLPSLFYYDD